MSNLKISQLPSALKGFKNSIVAIVNYNPESSGRTEGLLFSAFTALDVTGITTSQTITWDKDYWGVSGTSNVNLTLPSTTNKDGYRLIIKDESGNCGTYRIRLTPASGLIDGNSYVDMNINYMSLTCIVRGGNWYLI